MGQHNKKMEHKFHCTKCKKGYGMQWAMESHQKSCRGKLKGEGNIFEKKK